MNTHTATHQVAIVHGPANPDLDAALELAGMIPLIALADLRVWASGPPRAAAPVPAGVAPVGDGGPQRLLLTVPQAAAALGIGRTMTYQLI
nr:hypothetical protein [Actinomycetota bacterium]